MFHRSDRLLLRPIWPEDWPGIFSGIADEGIVRNLASAPWPYEEKDAREFTALPTDPLHPRFMITRARDALVIGCIGIDPVPGDETMVELGYWIARPHWGQGYATEAGRAVLEVAATLGHRELMGSHFLDNPASGKVLTKLGFQPTGRIVERHSCGRGVKAQSAEYRLDLSATAYAFSQDAQAA
ncbi:GNAT family N-acetyltransferase [Erythrobacter sp. YT30]|uniref:GNAT family N-acetyltransferase n=1 Tax=Erythrobacter sp. YT30 TaxID=1735012 RepID=UPI00076DC00E|nr:GNAT family N-acetyltransferase [Erythrobacter sp. YT30]KWV90582.1 GNAT family acetyltransferase [Erythrobacter sp. YT30]